MATKAKRKTLPPLTEDELTQRSMTIEKIKAALDATGISTKGLTRKGQLIRLYLDSLKAQKPQVDNPKPKSIPKSDVGSFDNSQLLNAIKSLNPDEIINALNVNININTPDTDGEYLINHLINLMSQTKKNREFVNQLLQEFIKRGADVNVKND